jgi:type IV secretory pathway TraG/TraD family ATPase VirD4
VGLTRRSQSVHRPRHDAAVDLGELIAQQGTLYVVSPSRIQQELAPLIATLLDGLCAHAIDLAITSPVGRLEHPLLLALDEVANIAPIRSLPRLLSEGIQQGIVPVLGVQDMSQARARWGEHETATMWSTPALRLVLAGVADPYTAQLVSDACGEQLVWRPQISENTSTSLQVERQGKTYTGEIVTPTPSSASEPCSPRASERCRQDERSRCRKVESRSALTCSPAPLA